MDTNSWEDKFSTIKRKGIIIDENILKETFRDVSNKALDKEMGVGYVAEDGYKPSARVVLQGMNPFIDNHAVIRDDNHSNAASMNIAGIAQHNDERIPSIQPSLSSSFRWTKHFLHLQVEIIVTNPTRTQHDLNLHGFNKN